MTPEEIDAAAQMLWQAERDRRQVGLLSARYPGMTLDQAYAVQAGFVARKGGKRVGWKIGLTSRAMQQQLGIDTPDSGILLEDMVFPDGSEVPADRFIAPRVEAEIVFALRADLGPDPSRDDVLAATDWVAPALEILDTRVVRAEGGKARTILDTVADNAANGGIVIGIPQHPVGDVDLRWVGAILKRDGIVEETGLGAGVLDDPVTGIIWLARRLGAYGMGLRAGDLVLSGSFVRAVEAPPGSRFHADFGAFGRVGIGFG
jgi:2-oxo-hept-3-ene-1,7-dioate hydratase